MRAAVPDGAAELLSFLPSLGTAETMVFGESVNLPMRVILNTLEEEYRPHSSSAEFTDLWNRPDVSPEFMGTVFDRWRARSLTKTGNQNSSGRLATPQAAVNSARHSLRQQAAAKPPQPQRPQQMAQPVAQPSVRQAVAASASQMRQHLQSAAAAKPSSISDVKSMLNTAFNRDM